jgi:hypothetical protein
MKSRHGKRIATNGWKMKIEIKTKKIGGIKRKKAKGRAQDEEKRKTYSDTRTIQFS